MADRSFIDARPGDLLHLSDVHGVVMVLDVRFDALGRRQKTRFVWLWDDGSIGQPIVRHGNVFDSACWRLL